MKKRLKESLALTWKWFQNSGVMVPEDGKWGVAERILLTDGNKTAEKTRSSFPAWTPKKGFDVIEQRRADCNLETAYLFLLTEKVFGGKFPAEKTAENILDFLFFRSGLLNRYGKAGTIGSWDWSHIRRFHQIYFDDNAWMCMLLLRIGRKYPRLNKKYDMIQWGMTLADLLADALPRYLADKDSKEPEFAWLGNVKLPHWGSLVCMALSEAYRMEKKQNYIDVIALYEKYLLEEDNDFTTSEWAYALLGSVCAYRIAKNKSSLKCLRLYADKLVSAMDPETGTIPSQHYEAPAGKNLADTIYTLNWAVLALQAAAGIDERYDAAYKKILSLLLQIQDRSRPAHLHGCWRGMYDMETRTWGGGNCFEGGADSIYTGWTNAPIGWVCAFELLNTDITQG
ncbi:MAG: hypothetical protein IJZ19_05195 [Lentisphaeria bacterium]|nr:hypothetical protein [Lentisphaeria bacterium]